jgi:hypothetical protein
MVAIPPRRGVPNNLVSSRGNQLSRLVGAVFARAFAKMSILEFELELEDGFSFLKFVGVDSGASDRDGVGDISVKKDGRISAVAISGRSAAAMPVNNRDMERMSERSFPKSLFMLAVDSATLDNFQKYPERRREIIF